MDLALLNIEAIRILGFEKKIKNFIRLAHQNYLAILTLSLKMKTPNLVRALMLLQNCILIGLQMSIETRMTYLLVMEYYLIMRVQ